MESIANYDAWKLASPEEYVDQNEISILERNLKVCPLCPGKAFFDESKGFWYVECEKCGCSVPGNDPQEVAARWNTRPPVMARNVVREVPRHHWTGW